MNSANKFVGVIIEIRAENREVEVLIQNNLECLIVDTAKLDKDSVLHLRIQKDGYEPKHYQVWKEAAEQRQAVVVTFDKKRYEGVVELVGKDSAGRYSFLQFVENKPATLKPIS